jgi:hypothetical protein
MVLIGDPRDSRFGSPLQLSRVHWVTLLKTASDSIHDEVRLRTGLAEWRPET